MPLDERSIKIRLGLILQGCVSAALEQSEFKTFVANPKYDDDSMTPDFLIPNRATPSHFIEVTQTEARNSFQMKILRYFEAVCEAKAYFGSRVIAVNVLFGDPALELPNSLVNAMYGFFDVNLCPRNDAETEEARERLDQMESAALVIATDEMVDKVESGLTTILQEHSEAIATLAQMLEGALKGEGVREQLIPLWDRERERLQSITTRTSPIAYAVPYKRPVLEGLLLSDESFEQVRSASQLYDLDFSVIRDLAGKALLTLQGVKKKTLLRIFDLPLGDFQSLVEHRSIQRLSHSAQGVLISSGLAERHVGVAGAIRLEASRSLDALLGNLTAFPLNTDLRAIAEDPFGQDIREMCKRRLDSEAGNRWYFEDIRSEQRRIRMAEIFLEKLTFGPEAVFDDLRKCAETGGLEDIEHTRCWIADLLACHVDISHNAFNKGMFVDPNYLGSIGNPFNNLTIRNSSVLSNDAVRESVLQTAFAAYRGFLAVAQRETIFCSSRVLATRLLGLRLDALVKRHSLNPLEIVIEETCAGLGAELAYGTVENVVSGASLDPESAGHYRVYWATAGDRRVLINALYVDDYGGRDKAKEWAARGRSFLYRLADGVVLDSNFDGMVMVLDGPWHSESVNKLERCGWVTCRPSELRQVLLQHLHPQFSQT
jgi:hypothetical protein